MSSNSVYGVLFSRNPRGPGVQPRLILSGLHMTYRHGERVGRIGRFGSFPHSQQRAHHQLHLRFSRVAVAGYAGLDFARRIAVYRDVALRRRQQHHSADFGKLESGLHIQGGEHGFDGDALRLKFNDQVAQHFVNFAQAFREMLGSFSRGAQRAEADHAAATPVTFDNAIAGGAGRRRINAEHSKNVVVDLRGLRHGTECTAASSARPQFFRGFVLGRTDE